MSEQYGQESKKVFLKLPSEKRDQILQLETVAIPSSLIPDLERLGIDSNPVTLKQVSQATRDLFKTIDSQRLERQEVRMRKKLTAPDSPWGEVSEEDIKQATFWGDLQEWSQDDELDAVTKLRLNLLLNSSNRLKEYITKKLEESYESEYQEEISRGLNRMSIIGGSVRHGGKPASNQVSSFRRS